MIEFKDCKICGAQPTKDSALKESRIRCQLCGYATQWMFAGGSDITVEQAWNNMQQEMPETCKCPSCKEETGIKTHLEKSYKEKGMGMEYRCVVCDIYWVNPYPTSV